MLKGTLRFFLLLAFTGCEISSSSSASSQAVLTTDAEGPGVYSPKYALVGTPFPVGVRAISLPGGNCGLAPCPGGGPNLTAVSAECDASACTAVVRADPQGVATFWVTPTAAGPTVLHVHVRGANGSDYSDTLPMTFLTSAHIEVHEDPILNRVKYAALQGAKLNWQITLDSDDGKRLAADLSAIQTTVDGDAYALRSNSMHEADYITLEAVQPGAAMVHLSLGASSRSMSLSVIDVSDVTSVEFHPIPVATSDQRYAETLEGPDVFSSDAVTSLTESLLQGPSKWALVLHTQSGTLAIGGASLLHPVPEDLGAVSTYDDGFFTFWGAHTGPTSGTLTGTIGSAVVSVPVTITN